MRQGDCPCCKHPFIGRTHKHCCDFFCDCEDLRVNEELNKAKDGWYEDIGEHQDTSVQEGKE